MIRVVIVRVCRKVYVEKNGFLIFNVYNFCMWQSHIQPIENSAAFLLKYLHCRIEINKLKISRSAISTIKWCKRSNYIQRMKKKEAIFLTAIANREPFWDRHYTVCGGKNQNFTWKIFISINQHASYVFFYFTREKPFLTMNEKTSTIIKMVKNAWRVHYWNLHERKRSWRRKYAL